MSGVSGLRLLRKREFLIYEEGEETAGGCSTLLSSPDAPEGMVTAVVATPRLRFCAEILRLLET